ncbi:MAG: hypothetical protein LUG13_09615 [Oscillospiraceae bacterium]|nr:hypothetical protein [Oscillospiraceae bacterium]
MKIDTLLINHEGEQVNFSNKLTSITKSLEIGQYPVVVKECSTLFEVVFRRIYSEALVSLPFAERNELVEYEKAIGKNIKGIQDFGLGELVGLFSKSKLLQKWSKYTGRDLGLINSMNFDSIVALRNRLVHADENCGQLEAELIFNYLKNLLAALGYINMEKAIVESFEKSPTIARGHVESEELADIRLIKERGVIINIADGTRNISFKVDTINQLFDTFLVEMNRSGNKELAQSMLWAMGFAGGKKFGSAINSQWDFENKGMDYGMKIDKWCEFDSQVGWGHVSNDIQIDTDSGEIKGHLYLRENFLCFNRKKKQEKLCNYMMGYCAGVLEELLDGTEVSFKCVCADCPQENPFKKECVFAVAIKE